MSASSLMPTATMRVGQLGSRIASSWRHGMDFSLPIQPRARATITPTSSSNGTRRKMGSDWFAALA
jgi:hypothetical protein